MVRIPPRGKALTPGQHKDCTVWQPVIAIKNAQRRLEEVCGSGSVCYASEA
jgi:hypothetical protein